MTDASRSPTDEELFRIAMQYYLQDINVSLPGQIEEYDAATQKASVKPLVQKLQAADDGSEILEPTPVIPGVPVVFPRGGNFFVSLPVAVGDFCLLIFCSRSIDKYKTGSGLDTNPDDFRLHDESDAVALMGFSPFSKALKQADPENMVIGMDSGVQIHIKPNGEIHLGSKDAADALALASKVESELKLIASVLNGTSTTPWVPLATDGGLALQTTAKVDIPTLSFPASVGSTVIKSE